MDGQLFVFECFIQLRGTCQWGSD